MTLSSDHYRQNTWVWIPSNTSATNWTDVWKQSPTVIGDLKFQRLWSRYSYWHWNDVCHEWQWFHKILICSFLEINFVLLHFVCLLCNCLVFLCGWGILLLHHRFSYYTKSALILYSISVWKMITLFKNRFINISSQKMAIFDII